MRKFLSTVRLESGLIIPAGAGAGKVLTSDASGNATWQVAPTVAAISLVSALPGSPSDGQVVRYQSAAMATDGVEWLLAYRAGSASAYKWECVGGTPLSAEVDTQGTTASATYAALATAGPTVTVPLAGDYDIQIGARMSTSGAGFVALMSFDVGVTVASDNDSAMSQSPSSGNTSAQSVTRSRRKTGLAAATALTSKYRTTGGTATIDFRWMKATPVRVG